MKNKEVNLRQWMAVKIVPSLLLLGFYWMCVRRDYKISYVVIQYGLIGLMLGSLLVIKSKREIFDEFARETLYKTDSICMRIAFAIMGIILFVSAFFELDGISVGYMIAAGLVLLSISRAVIFCDIDKRGL